MSGVVSSHGELPFSLSPGETATIFIPADVVSAAMQQACATLPTSYRARFSTMNQQFETGPVHAL